LSADDDIIARGSDSVDQQRGLVHQRSSSEEKIALFRSLYRRDRREDQLLQENGYLVLRFLAEDFAKELDTVLDGILRALTARRTPRATTHALKVVRASQS
jgi:hypothetical protein